MPSLSFSSDAERRDAAIAAIESTIVDVPTVRRHKLSSLSVTAQSYVIVQLRLASGIVGIGEAATLGGYSFFDPAQKPYNLRCRIRTDTDGRYRFRSILPSGYACPPDGPTQALLNQLGRHGRRPAHIHFFISAPGCRKLTTQINIDGDEYLYDDFAFATRDGLIPPVERVGDAAQIREQELNAPFCRIQFDFVLNREADGLPSAEVQRVHATAA